MSGLQLRQSRVEINSFSSTISFLSAISLSTYIVYNKITSIGAVREQQKQAVHNQSYYLVEK